MRGKSNADFVSPDLPFVGVIDLVAPVEGKQTVVDFKTAGSAPDESEAHMSDQLTAYNLAEPQAESLALRVLVKTTPASRPNVQCPDPDPL